MSGPGDKHGVKSEDGGSLSETSQGLKFQVSFFNDEHDNSPRHEVLTWDQLVAKLSAFHMRDMKSGPCWSPASYASGSKRGNAGVQTISVAVFDVDDGTDPKVIGAILTTRGLQFLIHSTFSSSPEMPKYRVVVPLAAPVPVADWPEVFPRLCALLTDGHTDPATKDPARIFFLPSAKPDAKTFLYEGKGRPVSMADLPAAPAEATRLTQIASVQLEGGKLPHGQHHRTIVSLAASHASRLGGVTEEVLVQSLKGALTPLLDDLPSHEREIREAARDALAKFGKGPEENEGQDGLSLFAEVRTVLKNYLYFPAEWCYDIAALWVMQAYIAKLLPSVFYLFFSASKGRGKTTALDVLAALTGALNASDISVAALVHSLKGNPGGTVCVDEFDVSRDVERDSALAAIARNGYMPGKPYLRWDPTKKKMEECPTFGAKAFGFRGSVDDALEDRGFTLPLPVIPLRGREGAVLVWRNSQRHFGDLPQRLTKWGAARIKEGMEERQEEDWVAKVEAFVGPESIGANRDTQLSGVVLAVADAVGIDIGNSLMEALGLKRVVADANASEDVDEAKTILSEMFARTGTLTTEAEFYVVGQPDFFRQLNARRKERGQRPFDNEKRARLREDLGIDKTWLSRINGKTFWKIPRKEWEARMAEDTSERGAPPPTPPTPPNGDADRGLRGLRGLRGAPDPPLSPPSDSPIPEEGLPGSRPTLAARALANARKGGSLVPDPPTFPVSGSSPPSPKPMETDPQGLVLVVLRIKELVLSLSEKGTKLVDRRQIEAALVGKVDEEYIRQGLSEFAHLYKPDVVFDRGTGASWWRGDRLTSPKLPSRSPEDKPPTDSGTPPPPPPEAPAQASNGSPGEKGDGHGTESRGEGTSPQGTLPSLHQVNHSPPESPSFPNSEPSDALPYLTPSATRTFSNVSRDGSLVPNSSYSHYSPSGSEELEEKPQEEVEVKGTGLVIHNRIPQATAPSREEKEEWKREWERNDGDPALIYPGGVLVKRWAESPDNVLYRPPADSTYVVYESTWEVTGSGAVVIYSDGAVVRRHTGEVLGHFRIPDVSSTPVRTWSSLAGVKTRVRPDPVTREPITEHYDSVSKDWV